MTIGIEVGSITDEIGSPDFFHAFFSTICANLEPAGWGTRFPNVMHKLYSGEVSHKDSAAALRELDAIRQELARFPVGKLVWDIEDRAKRPPWGDRIANTITDLSNYFITSAGRDLIAVLREALEELRNGEGSAKIVSY